MKKRNTILIVVISASIMALLSFSINKPVKSQSQSGIAKDDTTKSNPQIDIKVNKEYDDNGNIIRYDSSYSYIYTYPDGNTEDINIDSFFNNFKPYFFDHGFDIMQDPFHDFFDEDTLYQRHFFDNDFFMQQFRNEMFDFEQMIREMDSLRNKFIKEKYPEFEPQQEKQLKEDKYKNSIKI